ncbi:hypothetical protein [Halomonas sp. BM-2019]|uniref:hypothetical protein n=1 Tax=Halomonas sp. BM-2019 TaxID=2811227 RepID=UPI001B3C2501|nr:MAG: hypothetical protein J5F18_07405 [Halomonas sp. BM-2019]
MEINPQCEAEWEGYEASRQAYQEAWDEVGKAWEKYDEKLSDVEEYLHKAEETLEKLTECFQTQQESLAEPDDDSDDEEIHPHFCSLEQIANFFNYMEEVHAKEDELVEVLDELDAAHQALQQADSDWWGATTLAEYCEQHWAGKSWVEA